MSDEPQLPAEITSEQESFIDSKVAEIMTVADPLRREGILCHYRIGKCLLDEYNAEGDSRYGKGVMQVIAEKLSMSPQVLYSCQEVAKHYDEAEILELSQVPNVLYSHIRESVRIPDKAERKRVLLELANEPKTTASFRELALGLRDELSSQEESSESAPKGTRSGSKKGSRGASPLTPINRAGKASDDVGKALKDALEVLCGFEPESDQAAEKLNEALNESLGKMADALVVMAGFVEKSEEHLAINPAVTRAQVTEERVVVYREVADLLSKMSGRIVEPPKKLDDIAEGKPLEPPKKKRRKKGEPPVAPPIAPPPSPEDKSGLVEGDKERLREEMKEKAKDEMKEKARRAMEKGSPSRGAFDDEEE